MSKPCLRRGVKIIDIDPVIKKAKGLEDYYILEDNYFSEFDNYLEDGNGNLYKVLDFKIVEIYELPSWAKTIPAALGFNKWKLVKHFAVMLDNNNLKAGDILYKI